MHRIHALLLFAVSCFADEEFLRHTTEPSSTVANLGDRVVLKCNFHNIHVTDIKWVYNDVTLTSDSGSNRERRKRHREDRISHAATSDLRHIDSPNFDGAYSSEAWRNSVGQFSDVKKVRRKKDRRRKHKRGKEDHGYINRYVRSAEGARFLDAKLYGVQPRGDRLVIQNFSKRNVGYYFCVATYSEQTFRTLSAKVEMAYISNFTTSTPNSLIAQSIPFVIPCKLPDSVPPAQPKWQINGDTWIEGLSDRYMVLPSGSLLIENVENLNGSEFRCAAQNTVTGQTVVSSGCTKLIVDNDPSSPLITGLVYPSKGSIINVKVASGQTVIMECVSGGVSKMVWERDNGRIPDTATITKAGLNMTVASTDTGQYICRSHDSADTVTYYLKVEEIPVIRNISPSHVILTNSSDVTTLSCESQSGSKVNWKWYRNGDLINAAIGSRLNVSNAIGRSGGLYQCFGENMAGQGYAVMRVEESEDLGLNLSTSVAYFELRADPIAVSMPKIAISNAPTQPTSHTLHWTSTGSNIKLFSIKYYKEPLIGPSGVIHFPHNVVNVPSDRREVVLSNLEPSCRYTIEMVSVSNMNTRSEMEISSFGTGKENPKDPRPSVMTPEKNKMEKDGNVAQVPRSPSRPDVDEISNKQVSLMWNSRGNGGSPIIGYKIQRKEIDGKGGWQTIGEVKTFPAPVGNLQKGKTYKFRIIAYNAVGDSKPSSSSKLFPKRLKPKPLRDPPFITAANSHGAFSIKITWQYEGIPLSSITGYNIYYRPTDSDNEEDYSKEVYENPSASSYIIRDLMPEMQYDVKIAAFNALGQSPYSNVIILEMPKVVDGSGKPVTYKPVSNPADRDPDVPDRNDDARQSAMERNLKFLITGAVVGAILIVLLITVFCYWRKRGAQYAQSTPEMKQKNGSAGGYVPGKPCDHINMSKINANGRRTPNGTDSPSHHYAHSPHDTRCHCSRHHSNHSSLGRNAEYPPIPMGPGYQGWGAENYPNIHPNPMHMYMDPRHAYYPPHGIGRWVRGNNGEFCHIIPVDARKMAPDGGPEVMGHYLLPGGQMVTRTYDGNMTSADDAVHRPDHGYHSNEDGARTGSESQTEKSDDAQQDDDDDGNSTGGATSGVVTLNDVTIESRPPSPAEEENANSEQTTDNTTAKDDSDSLNNSHPSIIDNTDKTPQIDSSDGDKDETENTPFLNRENDSEAVNT